MHSLSISILADGGWSSWSVFSSCSKPCDGGIQNRTRTCTSPRPLSGGKQCTTLTNRQATQETHSITCNKQKCPRKLVSYDILGWLE